MTGEIMTETKAIQVVTAGMQGPPGPAPEGFTGSVNVPIFYGGTLNITVQNGLIKNMALYGM